MPRSRKRILTAKRGFTAWAVVAGGRYGGVEGRSKKEAEQRAAELALARLDGESTGEA